MTGRINDLYISYIKGECKKRIEKYEGEREKPLTWIHTNIFKLIAKVYPDDLSQGEVADAKPFAAGAVGLNMRHEKRIWRTWAQL